MSALAEPRGEITVALFRFPCQHAFVLLANAAGCPPPKGWLPTPLQPVPSAEGSLPGKCDVDQLRQPPFRCPRALEGWKGGEAEARFPPLAGTVVWQQTDQVGYCLAFPATWKKQALGIEKGESHTPSI